MVYTVCAIKVVTTAIVMTKNMHVLHMFKTTYILTTTHTHTHTCIQTHGHTSALTYRRTRVSNVNIHSNDYKWQFE